MECLDVEGNDPAQRKHHQAELGYISGAMALIIYKVIEYSVQGRGWPQIRRDDSSLKTGVKADGYSVKESERSGWDHIFSFLFDFIFVVKLEEEKLQLPDNIKELYIIQQINNEQ